MAPSSFFACFFVFCQCGKNSFEFSMNMLFQYNDNLERKVKLRNVQ